MFVSGVLIVWWSFGVAPVGEAGEVYEQIEPEPFRFLEMSELSCGSPERIVGRILREIPVEKEAQGVI